MIATVVIPVIILLLGNEFCEASPWLARKIVRWSAACRYRDSSRAAERAEELAALINNRPGNLLKVISACCFATSAAVSRLPSASAKLRAGLTNRTWPVRAAQVAIGSVIAILGTAGVVSAVWTVAAHGHGTPVAAVAGDTCTGLSWLALGIMVATGKAVVWPTFPLGIATGNIILYAGTGNAAHLVFAVFFLGLFAFCSVRNVGRLRAHRGDWRALEERVVAMRGHSPDCVECADLLTEIRAHLPGRHRRLEARRI